MRAVNTLVFEVRLRKASVNLFKQILCLFPLPARVQMGVLWLLMSLYSRGWSGLPGHMSGSNKTGWHHFTHCYQDVICFSSQWAPRATLKVWLYSGDTVVMRRHNLQKLFIAVRWWQHHKSHYLAGFEEKPTKPRHSRRAETHIERASQMQELKTVRWESGTDVSSLFECINH